MTATTETPALYAARPLFTVDGSAESSLTDAATRIVVEETIDGVARLEATFGNWGADAGGQIGYRLFDGALLDFGTEVAVDLGAGQSGGQVFAGRVSALEAQFPQLGGPELAVLAEDAVVQLRSVRRTRVFEDLSDADVVSRIARDHQLQASVDLDGPVKRATAQLNETDLGFVRRLVRAAGGEITFAGGKLTVEPRHRRSGRPVTIAVEELRECAITADVADQRTAVTVSGWDVDAKTAIEHVATDSAVQSEVGTGRSGPAVVSEVLGVRPEQLAHLHPSTSSEAQAYAEAAMRLLARRFVQGRFLIQGDARLRVGVEVELAGVGPLFDGAHTVTEVRHTFDAERGFETWFHTERAGLGQAR